MFTTPSGICKKPSELAIILINALFVFVVFMAVDALFFFAIHKAPYPYAQDIGPKLLYTFLLAAAYGHLYNKASFCWRPGSPVAFFSTSDAPGKECKWSWDKILNGLVFNVLLVLLLFAVQKLGLLILVNWIPDLFGFHGGLSLAADSTGVSQTGVSLVLAGIVLEKGGHTEDDPR